MREKLTTGDEVPVRSIMFHSEIAKWLFDLETNQLKQLGYKYYRIKVRNREGVHLSPIGYNTPTPVYYCLVIDKKSEEVFMEET